MQKECHGERSLTVMQIRILEKKRENNGNDREIEYYHPILRTY